jgi:peptidoglycan/xylan/chitin deacetylase (PgdA/CDA1 family)
MRLAFHRQSVTYFGTSPYKEESLCFFDVQQHPRVQKRIALTIDDAPCRFPQHEASQVSCVKALLQKYKAKATFMVVGSWCNQPEHRNDMISLLKEGHELGNHCMLDRSYEFDSPRVFGIAVDECSAIIQDLQTAAGLSATGVKWFRAPHGRFTQDMAQVLARRGLVNTMCDTYASCPIVQDPDFIAAHLTQTCQDGSILLIHMPEKHVRQWCLAALEKLLQGLQERGFRAVTVGEMARLAQFDPHQEPHQSIGFHRRNSMGTSLVKARGRVRSNSSLRSRRRSVST